MLQERFTKNLQRELHDRGWSQSDLARRMGVAPQYVQKYLRGITSPGLDVIEKFATALGLEDPCDLLQAAVAA